MVGRLSGIFAAILLAGTAIAGSGHAATVNVLYPFAGQPDGQKPNGQLVNVNGTLYGVTLFGGANNLGFIYKFTPPNGVPNPLYSFTGLNGDGAVPVNGMVKVGNFLYGTTNSGGNGGPSTGGGVIYRYSLITGLVHTVYKFPAGSDSLQPSSLINIGGVLYGTTYTTPGVPGNSDGVVYSFDPGTMIFHTLHPFANAEHPVSKLTHFGSLLYGATAGGGTNGLGTVYSIDPTNQMFHSLYSFAGGMDGANPFGGLTISGAYLYGDTFYGGSQNVGVVYRIDPSSTSNPEQVLTSLSGDGAEPEGDMLKSGNFLWSEATIGGTNGVGGIFKVNITTGHLTSVYTLDGSVEGLASESSLIKIGSVFYGTTSGGTGPATNGGIFVLTP